MNRTSCPRASALLLVAAALGGCAAGPDFQRPAADLDSVGYIRGEPMRETAAPGLPDAQRLRPGEDVRADWWIAFGQPELDALVRRAWAHSPTAAAARAALAAARETARAQEGAAWPNVQAGYNAVRTNQSTDPSAPASNVDYTLHTAQLTVGFVPDVFGGNARLVESLHAQAEVQDLQWKAARVTLAANVVAAAIQDAALREQMDITRQMIEAGATAVDLARRQHRAGFISRLELLLQENSLAQNEMLLPPLRKQFEQNRDQLRALCGAMPDAELPAFKLQSLQLPRELPLALPARVVETRPDVRAAEAQLHAATASIGVARAARLPQFNLTANAGLSASRIAQLASGGFVGLAGGIVQPLFDAGALAHREQAARELAEQAQAQYRQAVLNALQNVADTLHALEQDAWTLDAATRMARSAHDALELGRRQHGGGYLDRLALLVMEQSDRQARLAVATATAARLADSVALFQALGGGTWDADADAGSGGPVSTPGAGASNRS